MTERRIALYEAREIKIGSFTLILMDSKFWKDLRNWGQVMMRLGVFEKEEIGFGHVTDSPQEAVDLIQRGLHPAVRKRLKPN